MKIYMDDLGRKYQVMRTKAGKFRGHIWTPENCTWLSMRRMLNWETFGEAQKALDVYALEKGLRMTESRRSCKICGCTDEQACPGGCYWASENVCSECYYQSASKKGRAKGRAKEKPKLEDGR